MFERTGHPPNLHPLPQCRPLRASLPARLGALDRKGRLAPGLTPSRHLENQIGLDVVGGTEDRGQVDACEGRTTPARPPSGGRPEVVSSARASAAVSQNRLFLHPRNSDRQETSRQGDRGRVRPPHLPLWPLIHADVSPMYHRAVPSPIPAPTRTPILGSKPPSICIRARTSASGATQKVRTDSSSGAPFSGSGFDPAFHLNNLQVAGCRYRYSDVLIDKSI